MSSVFSSGYSLLSKGQGGMLEDFLTELVTEVFKDLNALQHFFKLFSDTSIRVPQDVSVSTQETFPKILDHEIENIPDIIIQFNDGEEKHIAFFENKIDAFEGKEPFATYDGYMHGWGS